jgi:hypothetical protein
MSVCLFSCLVLSSDALSTVAPLIAALLAAMMVKSLPVMPSKTSLRSVSKHVEAVELQRDSHVGLLLVLGEGKGIWWWDVEK